MMNHRPGYIFKLIIIFTLVGIFLSGCVYFNTFYNARRDFNEAEKARKKTKHLRGSAGSAKYKKAIERSLKVIENHPNSKWYDDALYVLGVSYFHTKQYNRAERRFREILANYPDSKYSRESLLYLAKAKLEQNDADNSREIFEKIFLEESDRSYKTEAAFALGMYHFDRKEFEEAEIYFKAIRDSLGTDEEQKRAQTYIADGYFDQFSFNNALKAYLQILGMDPDADERYHSLYQSAICCYRLQRIDDGMNYIEDLIKDEVYFDSLGSLRFALAEGYESDGDLLQAEIIYNKITEEDTKKTNVAIACYYLGLIYQFDYDELIQAKEYYDRALKESRSTKIARDALRRSTDIGKLSTFARTLEIDTATTQEMIDEAAEIQYSLAEHYWLNLDKPDTAILEMQYLIDSFSSTYIVPKAMIALSGMYLAHLQDTTGSDSILYQVLQNHARSDYVEESIAALGLKGTSADTGYAAVYVNKAEDALIDYDDWETARENYQLIVDSFPDSKNYLSARFNLIWLEENYNSPGDSSLIFAYTAFADSFPGTRLALEAARRTNYIPPPAPTIRSEKEEEFDDELTQARKEKLSEEKNGADVESDELETYNDPRLTLYISPSGDTIILLDKGPELIEEEFEFPSQAFSEFDQNFFLYFQILLDFSGKVTDYILKIRSENEEINERVSRTVATMTFDPLYISTKVVDYNLIPDESGGYWFVYKYLVTVPNFLR